MTASSSTAASNRASFPVDCRSRLSPLRYDTPTKKHRGYYLDFRSYNMQAVLGRQKGGHGPRRSMCRPWKLGTRTRHRSVSRAPLRERRKLYRMWCFVNNVFNKNHALYVHLTYKDVMVFGTGRSTNYIAWKLANKQSSCSTRSHEVTHEPCTSSNYKNSDKNLGLLT